jgi:hypothetical protein
MIDPGMPAFVSLSQNKIPPGIYPTGKNVEKEVLLP